MSNVCNLCAVTIGVFVSFWDVSLASAKEKRIRAQFQLPEVTTSTASGKIDFRSAVDTLKRDERLKITVKVPLPNTIPTVSTQREAENLDLRAMFYRDGMAYAICELAYNPSAATKNPAVAEYKVQLRSSGKKSRPKLKTISGSCLINLDTESERLGLPRIKKGDSVNIEEEDSGEFLGVIVR
jgi:hypothetical protein